MPVKTPFPFEEMLEHVRQLPENELQELYWVTRERLHDLQRAQRLQRQHAKRDAQLPNNDAHLHKTTD